MLKGVLFDRAGLEVSWLAKVCGLLDYEFISRILQKMNTGLKFESSNSALNLAKIDKFFN